MRRLMALVTAIVFVGTAAFPDAVIFKDERKLEGDEVEILAEHEKGVDVKVAHGEITVRWPHIKKLIIDYEAHLASMQAESRDTPRGLYRFVQLLLRHDMTDEAVGTCVLILGKEDVPEDVLFGLARLTEEQEKWAIAHRAYERIYAKNPRSDVAERMDKIAPLIKKEEEGKGEEAEKEAEEEAEGEAEEEPKPEEEKKEEVAEAIEYLEAEDDWEAEAWGNDAEVTIEKQGVRDKKNRILSVVYEGKKDKTAVRLGGRWDLSEYKYLAFDIWNAGDKSLGLSLALNTFPGWKFHESQARRIPPKKWITHKVPLDRNDFKTADSNWRHTSKLGNPDNVRQIILLIYNTESKGSVYFDNIRFIDRHGKARRE